VGAAVGTGRGAGAGAGTGAGTGAGRGRVVAGLTGVDGGEASLDEAKKSSKAELKDDTSLGRESVMGAKGFTGSPLLLGRRLSNTKERWSAKAAEGRVSEERRGSSKPPSRVPNVKASCARLGLAADSRRLAKRGSIMTD